MPQSGVGLRSPMLKPSVKIHRWLPSICHLNYKEEDADEVLRLLPDCGKMNIRNRCAMLKPSYIICAECHKILHNKVPEYT
ncbi:hypothetical protein IEQ34_004800 [Dendrobium chrysotoxum]|uniref:Uncharacterized protein n=1 Tax=Dendrobium chrysotoxum TaxID=161865 RepID=A0AAV7H6U3_DENCH|nr:hypothetical protein IEQ34_004800 [Dendrobium chrysotoxum]